MQQPRKRRLPAPPRRKYHSNTPLGQPGAGARRTRRRAPWSVGQCCPQARTTTAAAPLPQKRDGRPRARDGRPRPRGAPFRARRPRHHPRAARRPAGAGAESFFEAPRASQPLLNTQAGPARGAAGHPRHARRGERRGRPGSAGDRPASRGHRGRVAGSEGGVQEAHASDACIGARNGAGRTSGGNPDGPAGPRPRPVPRPLAVTDRAVAARYQLRHRTSALLTTCY